MNKMTKLKQEIAQVNSTALVFLPLLLFVGALLIILVGLLMLNYKIVLTGGYVMLVGICLPPYFLWQRAKAVIGA